MDNVNLLAQACPLGREPPDELSIDARRPKDNDDIGRQFLSDVDHVIQLLWALLRDSLRVDDHTGALDVWILREARGDRAGQLADELPVPRGTVCGPLRTVIVYQRQFDRDLAWATRGRGAPAVDRLDVLDGRENGGANGSRERESTLLGVGIDKERLRAVTRRVTRQRAGEACLARVGRPAHQHARALGAGCRRALPQRCELEVQVYVRVHG
jgi:hypothetical protein